MQRPTCTGLRVRSPSDAHVIFHAVSLDLLPIVSRRLDTEERRAISSGCVFVWEERGPNAEATGLGIERWTDSIHWGPSRVRDEFLFYHERESASADVEMTSDSDTTTHSRRPVTSHGFLRDNLVKQTYSVFVETPRGRRKWHLIAYFTQESLDYLRTIDDFPRLASLHVPPGKYKSARSSKRPPPPSFDPHHLPIAFGSAQAHYPEQITSPFSKSPNSKPYVAGLYHKERVELATRNLSEKLAPLIYLQNIPPPRRHPMDEKALMSFTPGLT